MRNRSVWLAVCFSSLSLAAGAGPGQMTIVAGNGELYRSGQANPTAPLTVQITDGNGNPVANQAVTFQITGPLIGSLDTTNTTTDQNGMASTNFIPTGSQTVEVTLASTTVNASSALGSVNFTETVFVPGKNSANSPFAAQVGTTSLITVGEADVLPDALVFQVNGTITNPFPQSGPIPNIGIRIADAGNPANNGPGSCQGNPLTDQNGMVDCAFLASCSAGIGLHGFSVSLGEYFIETGYSVNIIAGSSRAIAIPLTNSGNNQNGSPGATLTHPLTALVTDKCGTPIPGVTVTWKVTQGSATLSAASSVSDPNGDATTQVTLGATPGAVQIVASLSATAPSVTFTVTAIAGGGGGVPVIQSGGIVPVGSTVNTIQPGEWVSIFGANLAASPVTWNGTFTTSLGGTSVIVNGKAAYLSYVSPTQINLQAPDDATTGPVPVGVITASGSATSSVTLEPYAPSFLLLDSKHVAGIIPRSNGSGAYGGGSYDIIGPTGTSLGYPTVSAKAGDTIELFAVGLGPTSPPVPAGQVFSSAAPTTAPVSVLINNVSVTPAFAGLTGAGLYQINLTVPAGLNGDLSLTATVGGAQTQANVVISVGTFTATTGSLTLVSGANQTALVNTQFAEPLVVQLRDNNNNPQAGATVNFSVTGPATLSPASAVTNAQGQASVSITAGSSAGLVTIAATSGTFTVNATMTVQVPPPAISASSFTNAASGQPGLVPCGLAKVTGSGVASGVTGVIGVLRSIDGSLPYTLAGVSISVGGIPAPLSAVSNQNGVQQVTFQTPCETAPGSATVEVQVGSGTTVQVAIVSGVTVLAAQPGIITYAGPGGINYGLISAADGTTISATNLAHPGQTYNLIATGLGQTTPPAATNAPGTGAQSIPASQVILGIDNIGVPVTSVQYLEGGIGEYVITFTIPAAVNGLPFPTGTNFPMVLGIVTAAGQTVYENAPVAIPGIQ